MDTGKKKYARKKPTLKQIQALQYMNQGMSKRQALLKAGYSIEVASHPSRAFMKSDGVKLIGNTMYKELAIAGITSEFMVEQFKEWFKANKTTNSFTEPDKSVPDYKIRMDAYREWKKLVDQHDASNNPQNGQLKRTLTINEFVTGKEEEEVISGESK